ncbi:hypothetical protein LCGC14_1951970 [marine sediment metagenome]|uniref:Uncharacterized protein n=1 Tax=marine sediment metagenome TaxID=412755 RepID=A0A0F9FHF0_9ZZZZ
MGDMDAGSAVTSDLTNAMVDYSVDAKSTDAAGDQKETTYQNTDWETDYGYYNAIPEFKTAVDAKVTWTVGAGFKSDEETELLLKTIKGNGKDSFNSILSNMITVKTISKDSFAEIIRDNVGVLINLKPLDPSSIVIVARQNGRIKRYDQVSKSGQALKSFKPEQIFHLSHNRVADEIHGNRIIDSLKWLIDARNEAMVDWRMVLHWNVKPRWKISLDTDDTAKIAEFKAKYDAANAVGENMYIPKGTVEVEVLGVAPNATLNPLAWIDKLGDYFFQAVNVPQIIIGNAKEFTDASSKIVYLSYEQNVKREQLYVEEQVLNQLNLEIHLTFPASLQNELISDQPGEPAAGGVEEEPIEKAAQPNDTKEELEGKT